MKAAQKHPLYSRAVVDATTAYHARCNDLRAIRPCLDLLEADMPELERRRIAPQPEQIRWLENRRALSIHMVCKDDANLLYQALLELGYVEGSRQEFLGGLTFVDLIKGSLRINVAVHFSKDAA